MMAWSDFVSSPLAHPLCYQCCYLLQLPDGQWIPFTRFMKRTQLRQLLSEGLYIAPGPLLEGVFRDVIDALWSGAFVCSQMDAVLSALRVLLESLFNINLSMNERLKVAEQQTRAIYVIPTWTKKVLIPTGFGSVRWGFVRRMAETFHPVPIMCFIGGLIPVLSPMPMPCQRGAESFR